LVKVKEGENFNHPSTIFRSYGASAEIGQKGAFCKGLNLDNKDRLLLNINEEVKEA